MNSHRNYFEAIVFLMNKRVEKLSVSQLKKIEGVQTIASSYAFDRAKKEDFTDALILISESFKRSSSQCKHGYDVYNRAGHFVKTVSVVEFIRTLARALDEDVEAVLKRLDTKNPNPI